MTSKIEIVPGNVHFSTSRCNLSTILNWISRKEITLNTNIKWSDEKASQFIECIMLRVPITDIYLKQSKKTFSIINGGRRFNALWDYIACNKPFTDFQFYPEFNGKTFEELPDFFKKRIKESYVTLHILKSESSEVIKEIERRLR